MTNAKPKPLFDIDALQSVQGLGAILRRIQQRLQNEGYTFKDGIIYPPKHDP